MLPLYRTLSFRYLSRRKARAGLIALCVGLGVATLVATQSLNFTMARAAVFAANPTSGFSDLIVSNGELPVPLSLERELAQAPGVARVDPRIFAHAFAPELGGRPILVLGIDIMNAVSEVQAGGSNPIEVSRETRARFTALFGFSRLPFVGGAAPTLLGRELFESIPKGKTLLKLQRGKATAVKEYSIAGPIDASGDAAALAGFVAVLDLVDAIKLFELPAGQVHRFDIGLTPGADPRQVRKEIDAVLRGRAQTRTFDEHSQATQNVMAGMQTGFALCGLAALVVGLFLVYNVLSVTVAERRHEIGVLLSLGATRGQVLALFAGEAVVIGAIGSLIGLPLGAFIAWLGVQPMIEVLGEVFFRLDARVIDLPWQLLAAAALAGIATTLIAALVPALRAARERPADAVRKVVKAASPRGLMVQFLFGGGVILTGVLMILLRDHLPSRMGTMGGLCIILTGALVLAPFLTGLIARMMQPVIRAFLGIEWRLAADNLVRAPGRTGLVIGALAAGVSLVMQTAGVIRSNRESIRAWIDDAIAADIVVTSGSPVGAGGQTQPMPESLVAEFRKIAGVELALPVRMRKLPYGDTQVLLMTLDAGDAFRIEKSRLKDKAALRLYEKMDQVPNGIIISENMAALHKLRPGDVIALPSPRGEVPFTILGAVPDYSWNHGTLFMHRRDYLAHWADRDVDVIDLYLASGADHAEVKRQVLSRWGATRGLHALTRGELIVHIDQMVEKVYGVAYAQQIVVMVVAGLGFVMALLISVLQRRHEMGLLRAVGASRGQVMHSVVAEACLMGFIGALIGVVVGLPMQWYVLNVVLLEEAGFAFPVYIPWREAAFVTVASLATACLAGWGPALVAVRQRIPDAIAYE